MRGAQALTQEMDVYAFAICCWEILMMGALPWQFMDDNAVQSFRFEWVSSPVSFGVLS
jgi:abelson tyrosine-protein kinase 1